MFFSKVYKALETKEVDAQENYYSQILTAKLYKVQDYLSVTNHAHGSLSVIINEGIWKGLSNEQQKMLRESALEARLYQRALSRKKSAATLEKLAALGMKINTVDAKELARMKALMKPAAMKVATYYDADILDLFHKHVK